MASSTSATLSHDPYWRPAEDDPVLVRFLERLAASGLEHFAVISISPSRRNGLKPYPTDCRAPRCSPSRQQEKAADRQAGQARSYDPEEAPASRDDNRSVDISKESIEP